MQYIFLKHRINWFFLLSSDFSELFFMYCCFLQLLLISTLHYLWCYYCYYCNLGHLSHGQNNYETIHVMSTSIIDIYLEKYWFCTLEKMKIITKYSLRFVRVALLICENIYVLSRRWRRTEEPDMLQSMGVQRIWQDLVTEQQ